jgi:hypothetical protein
MAEITIRDPSSGQLALVGGHRNATKAQEECSEGLWRCLTESEGAEDAVRKIARNPTMLDEAKAAAPRLAARTRPGGAEAVLAALVPLKTVYGLGDKSEGEWVAFWGAYVDALEVLPAEAIVEAIVIYNRQGAHFPKPGELFKIADVAAKNLHIAAYRAKKAADYRERHAPAPSAEDRAKVKALLDELRGPDGSIRLGMKAMPRAAGPAPGLTRQGMADKLRRQADQDADDEPI